MFVAAISPASRRLRHPFRNRPYLRKPDANRHGIRDGLALAACALLAGAPAHAVDPLGSTADDTFGDFGGLLYNEDGGRVSVKEGVASVRHVESDDTGFSVTLTYDTLSGGSPNGALPSHAVQTFATPSGRTLVPPATTPTPPQTCTTASGVMYSCGGSSNHNNSIYTVAPGALPLDKSFQDQREAISLSRTDAPAPTTHLTSGAGYSHELDFQSLSLNGGLTQDFNRRNSTLALGANFEYDISNPVGGTPVPLSDYATFAREADRTKTVNGLLLGFTQVLTRHWLTQLNFLADVSRGYQADPYKIVSGLDSSGNVVGYIHENRPDYRNRHGIYWESRYAFDQDMVVVSWRAMQDNWGIASHTAELNYRYELGGGLFLEPHYRWYRQDSADFYRLYVVQGDPYLQDVSADPRLGAFTAQTIGLKYGYVFDRNSEVSLRVERYEQKASTNTAPILPQLDGLDLVPGLGATIIEGSLRFLF